MVGFLLFATGALCDGMAYFGTRREWFEWILLFINLKELKKKKKLYS